MGKTTAGGGVPQKKGGPSSQHTHKKGYRDYDSIPQYLECAKKPGVAFSYPSARPYDGYVNKVAWSIDKATCGNGKIAVRILVAGQDRGTLLQIDKDTPMHGCIAVNPVEFNCGEPISLVVMPVNGADFCGPCGLSVTLTQCRKYKKHKPKCPEILEAWNSAEQEVVESPVVGNPTYVVVDLDTKRALPPTPHITDYGGGVFGLKHGLYEIGYQIGAKSPQSTDVLFGGDIQVSADNGVSWSLYPASESDARFHYGAVGGKVSNSRGTMTFYVPCDPADQEKRVRLVVWRSKDSTEVDTLIQGNAIRISRWCDCPRHECDDDGYGHG